MTHLHVCQGYVGHPSLHPCTYPVPHQHFPDWLMVSDRKARKTLIWWLMRRPLTTPSRWAA